MISWCGRERERESMKSSLGGPEKRKGREGGILKKKRVKNKKEKS